jgi:hypothetical protein
VIGRAASRRYRRCCRRHSGHVVVAARSESLSSSLSRWLVTKPTIVLHARLGKQQAKRDSRPARSDLSSRCRRVSSWQLPFHIFHPSQLQRQNCETRGPHQTKLSAPRPPSQSISGLILAPGHADLNDRQTNTLSQSTRVHTNWQISLSLSRPPLCQLRQRSQARFGISPAPCRCCFGRSVVVVVVRRRS